MAELEGAAYWDRVSKDYNGLYGKAWSRFEDETLRADLQSLLAQCRGRRVLDVGCGAGLGYELLGADDGTVDYVGLDVSEGMLSLFRDRHPKAVLQRGSADDLGRYFSPGQFDLIISTNVASSFVQDIGAFTRSVFELLPQGGVTRLSFLNRSALRRILHLKTSPTEDYRTRGDSGAGSVPALTVTAGELREHLIQAGFVSILCQHRSILGGVWERGGAIAFEKVLRRLLPGLGHEVAAVAFRPEG